MIRLVKQDLLDLDDSLNRNDHRRSLVSWDKNPNMADAGLFDELIEFFRVLGVDQSAATC